MGNFKRRDNSDRGTKNFSNKKFSGRSFDGGKSGYQDRDRDSRGGSMLHKATCSNCGKECEVPFRPNGKKPVFCSICFDKQGGAGASKFGQKSFSAPRFENSRTPEFSRDHGNFENKSIEQLKSQFAELNVKLDKILHLLSTPVSVKTEEVESEEPVEKPSFKMKKKVSPTKKILKKK